MIRHESNISLFSVMAYKFTIHGVNNNNLASEVLSSQERLSYDPRVSMFEDTVFNPQNGSEGKKLLDSISEMVATNGLRVSEVWSQIHRPLESTSLHNHKGGDITEAFVYYVSVPQGAGALTFQFENGEMFSINPQPSELYVFPAWVMHKVSKNLSGDIRISIAGNLSPI